MQRGSWLGVLAALSLGGFACGGGACPTDQVREAGRCVPAVDADAMPDASNDGCLPDAETCDGTDEDCDGAIDESLLRACGTETGRCEEGIERCILGEWLDCDAVLPEDETCGGVDEDCDGATDEGCECDPGATQPCGPDAVGVCVPGTQTCGAEGRLGACEGAVEASPETCNGLDDDCNGTEDDLPPGPVCGSDIGRCEEGVTTCVDAALVCAGEVGPLDEACNGVDDDCDGRADEGVRTAYWPDADGDGFGDASRPATLACDPPAALTDPVTNDADCDDACPSCFDGAAEICDGLNNDCDQDDALDEGIGSCVFGALVACATTCGTVGLGPCDATCEPPDDDPACVPPAEVCNGVDDDCDGLQDEDLQTLAQRPTLSSGFDDADDVRIVPTRHGFLAIVNIGTQLFAQRLDPDGTPRDSSRRVDSGNVQFFDAARLGSDRVVVAWNTTHTDEIRARLLRDTGGRPALVSLESVVDATAERFADVAVAATPDHVLFAYGARSTRSIRLTRTSPSLLDPIRFNRSSTISPLGAGDLFLLAHDEPPVSGSEQEFTLAWHEHDPGSEGDVHASSILIRSDGRPAFGLTQRFAPCRHPMLAHAGDRTRRVLGCVDGTQYLLWNLTPSSGPDGAPGVLSDIVGVTRGTQRTHALVFAGGRWILAGETRPAAGFDTYVGVREADAALAQVGATAHSPRVFRNAHAATGDDGAVVVLTGRDGSGTIPYELTCE